MQQPVRRRGRPKELKSAFSPPRIQALERALDVLETLAAHEGVTLTELSNRLRQSPATMHRVLSTLERRGYVDIDAERQEWVVGPEAFRLGSAFLRRTGVVDRSRPVMRELTAKTGETANLGILQNGNVLFVGQVESNQTIRAFFPHGTSSPLHASGIGKALMSAFDDETLDVFLRKARLDGFTERTVTAPEELREAVALIRRRGYALDDEERTVGMRCVAAPIFNSYGEAFAGISVSGPTARMTDIRIREIGPWVADAAARISRHLGAA